MLDFSSLLNALKQFFPKKEYCPWTILILNANEEWKIPPRKIYEVYAYLLLLSTLQDLNSRNVAVNRFSSNQWFPNTGSVVKLWAFDNVDPVTGQLTYLGDAPVISSTDCPSKAECGWIMSGNEGLKSSATWVVRWRERKDLGSE